ncbi:MAG: PD-(D/E)XK nuclease family protein [Gammaproteobacteria bacterium]
MTDDEQRHKRVVVTASRRLARHLRLEEAVRRSAAGEIAWSASRYVPWANWLRELWQSSGYRPESPMPAALLTPRENRLLWERATVRALGDGFAGRSSTLAAQAAASWQRACDWLVPLAEITAAARSPDTTFLARAGRYFTAACRAGDWQDPANLAARIAERLADGRITIEGSVEFAGFERPSPAERQLTEAAEHSGADIGHRPSPDRAATTCVRPAADRDAELCAAGAWARERLLARPGARVGIIVPDLASRPRAVARLVAEGFSPGWQFDPRRRQAVDVSYGLPLADYGPIDTALTILGILSEDPDFLVLSRLLRSPHLAAGEAGDRALLEVELRRLPDRRWDPARLGAAIPESLALANRPFLALLQHIATVRADWRRQAAPAVWAERVDALLSDAGWGGSHGPLASESYQLVNAWRSLLNQLAGVGRVSGPIRGTEAVRELATAARETLFQPESDGAEVPVMGILEASGMSFDALWISGMDTTTWPPAQRPDPLLPMALQREYGMPDATPADTLDYATRIFTGLTRSAAEVVVSWPRRDGDAELAASPLLEDLPQGPEVATVVCHAAALAGTAAVESVTPDAAPPLATEEKLPGGHGALTAQRTQPFDAFARYRLRADPLETPVAGLSARDRGTVIHRALERVYRRWPSRSRLAEAGDPARAEAARSAVDAALARFRIGADERLAGLIAMESDRCTGLVTDFVDVDLQRPEFDEVICEQPRVVRVGPLELSIRPDRIDRVGDGWVVIDYKTGTGGTVVGSDPDDPRQLQLVVYALSQPGPVRALAIAVVHPHRIAYVGVHDGEIDWPGRSLKAVEDWDALLNAWKSQAHSLAEAIAAGDARLNLTLPGSDQRPFAVLSRVAELVRHD